MPGFMHAMKLSSPAFVILLQKLSFRVVRAGHLAARLDSPLSPICGQPLISRMARLLPRLASPLSVIPVQPLISRVARLLPRLAMAVHLAAKRL